MTARGPVGLGAAAVCALVLAACGGSSHSGASTTSAPSTSKVSTVAASAHQAGSVSGSSGPPAVSELPAAEHPTSSQFPAANGRSLKQLALLIKGTATLGAGTETYTPGLNRYAFALTDKTQRFIYAPSAVYVATSPSAPAKGPILAPADSVSVAPRYRSVQNSGPGALKAVYSTQLSLPKSGVFDILVLTRVGHRLLGSTGEVAVALSTPIPGVGQRPPDISTLTLATANGNVSLLTTRQPPENMHSVSFSKVLGKKPVALLVSTPALCTSRVCGPVTDIMVQLQHEFGNRLTFIHQEVYVDNNPTKGLRQQLKAFHLETEPWLFTVNKQGVIAARIEGVFGINEARDALEAALR